MRTLNDVNYRAKELVLIEPTYEEAVAEILFNGFLGNDRQYLYDYVHNNSLENSLYLKTFCNGWEEEFNDN